MNERTMSKKVNLYLCQKGKFHCQICWNWLKYFCYFYIFLELLLIAQHQCYVSPHKNIVSTPTSKIPWLAIKDLFFHVTRFFSEVVLERKKTNWKNWNMDSPIPWSEILINCCVTVRSAQPRLHLPLSLSASRKKPVS